MDTGKVVLGTVDIIIFALMLTISASIGVYFRIAGGKQRTTDEYFLAGKDMSIMPVVFSLMASATSAITIIGIPTEMYKYGTHMAFINIGYIIGTPLSLYVSLPVFFNMEASTVYVYLERRFGKLARTFSSFAYIAQAVLYTSIVLYAPALALSSVTNLSTWMAVISTGAVCTFYCTLGGMKAVLWTDVFQAILMYLCIFTILIKGCADVGGIGNVFRIAGDGERLVIPSLTEDLTTRYTMWNLIVHGIIQSLISFGGSQVLLQRLFTLRNLSRVRRTVYLSMPMSVSFHLMTCLAGIVIYANFAKCDPMTSPAKPISSADQLLPYYMMTTLKDYPGLSGLCICGIFSASLSSVSSAMNSMTAVTMQDVVFPFCAKRGISQRKAAFSAKIITLFYGLLCVTMTFIVANFGDVIQVTFTVVGMVGAPTAAVFYLGMTTTRANEKGVIIGLISSIAIATWLSFGASSNASPPVVLPLSTEGCPDIDPSNNYSSFNNITLKTGVDIDSFPVDFMVSGVFNTTDSSDLDNSKKDIFILYKLSYLWFAPIGFFCSVIIGYLASIIINLLKGEINEVSQDFISPSVRWLYKKKHFETSVPLVLQPTTGDADNNVTNTMYKENERF